MANQGIFQRLRRGIGVVAAVLAMLAGMAGMLLVMADLLDQAARAALTQFAAPVPVGEQIVARTEHRRE